MLKVTIPKSVVNANFRMSIERVVADFISDGNLNEYDFPESFLTSEILFVRKYVDQFDLKTVLITKSKDYLFNFRTKPHSILSTDALSQLKMIKVTDSMAFFSSVKSSLVLMNMTEQIMYKLICKINDSYNNNIKINDDSLIAPKGVQRSNSSIVPQSESPSITVPPTYFGEECMQQRMNFPIYPYRNQILQKITSNQIFLIQSSTGSGKSTQIPQYIMEEATELNKPCRIICAQPRRLSAVSVAERVAYERNEEIGKTVGYQIRLESKVSPNSNLIYCTNGVLLRCLMSGDTADFFNNATHLVIF